MTLFLLYSDAQGQLQSQASAIRLGAEQSLAGMADKSFQPIARVRSYDAAADSSSSAAGPAAWGGFQGTGGPQGIVGTQDRGGPPQGQSGSRTEADESGLRLRWPVAVRGSCDSENESSSNESLPSLQSVPLQSLQQQLQQQQQRDTLLEQHMHRDIGTSTAGVLTSDRSTSSEM